MKRNSRIALLLAVAVILPLILWPAAGPADAAPNPCAQPENSSGGTEPGTNQPAVNQIASVTLAHAIASNRLFGPGNVKPIGPATSFISTDVPYAVVKINNVCPGAAIVVRLLDPTGATYEIQGAPPKNHNGQWKSFEFVVPMYILGTDLETHYGTWHVNVLVEGKMVQDVPFEWTQATVQSLAAIKTLVDNSPMTADLHWRYGAALAQLGREGDAEWELQNAIKLDPKYALYYITLGRIYELENRKAEAVHDFQQAMTIHGSYYDSVFSSWAQAELEKVQSQ
jgi:hypothetical protein